VRRDHRPLYLKKLQDKLNSLFVRHFLLPQFDRVGRDCRFAYPRHINVSGSRICLGDNVHITALPDKPVRLAVFPSAEETGSVTIGNYCIINPGVRMTSASAIEIGDSCMIAMNAYLSDADWHDLQHRVFAPGRTAPIILGKNVWIGDSALVTKGVTIGRNSVVGAYSVVTRDVPANTIVAGNPAKAIGEVDDSHLTTREHLFNGALQFEAFEADYLRKQLGPNKLISWLGSLVKPGIND
jgi:acetyltransferase-like isoleucine patch superfamily enzyme